MAMALPLARLLLLMGDCNTSGIAFRSLMLYTVNIREKNIC